MTIVELHAMEVTSSRCTELVLVDVHCLMHRCLLMQPGSQKEMQIDFDDDESPQQTEQGQPTAQHAAKQPRVQVYLIPALPQPCLSCAKLASVSVIMIDHLAALSTANIQFCTAVVHSHQLLYLIQLNPLSVDTPVQWWYLIAGGSSTPVKVRWAAAACAVQGACTGVLPASAPVQPAWASACCTQASKPGCCH